MQVEQRQTESERWALVAVANVMHQRTVQKVLQQEGFNTVTASDTDSAMAALEDQVGAFQLLLLDFDLPGLGALDVLRVYTYLTIDTQAGAIVRIAEQTEESLVSCLAAGVDQCLPIPTDCERLRATVRALLPRRVMAQAVC